MGDKICAYIRLSEEDKKEGNREYSKSILNQIKLIELYAANNHMGTPQKYIDDGYSGINFDRPAMVRLKRDIEDGKVDVVITKDFSRLGRDYIETSYFITEYFPRYNVRYISVNDNYDSSRKIMAIDDSIIALKNIVNEKVVKDASKKITQVKEMKSKQGNFMGFIAPYGYIRVSNCKKTTLEPDGVASKIVKGIFEDIAHGKSVKDTVKDLNKNHIEPPIRYLNMSREDKLCHHEWNENAIYRIIRNTVYIGNNIERKSFKENYRQKKRIYIPVKYRKVIKGTHLPIISSELFTMANKKIRSYQKRNLQSHAETLTDMVICGKCGKKMRFASRIRESGNITEHFVCNKKDNGVMCKNRSISALKLNKIVENCLKCIIEKHVDSNFIINRTCSNEIKRQSHLIRELKYNEDNHNSYLKKLYLDKAMGNVSEEEFNIKRTNQIRIKMDKEKVLKQRLEYRRRKYNKENISKQYHDSIFGEYLVERLLNRLVEKITVFENGTVEIKLKCSI